MALALPNASASPISTTWRIDNHSDAINELTFHITVEEAPTVDHYYFANQFAFTGGNGIGYIGLQPTDNASDGSRRFRAIFSSFRADSTPSNPNCHSGADGGKGVSCKTIIPGELGVDFQLRVVESGGSVTGTVTDTKSGHTETIGEWTVGADAGTLAPSELSWVENYLMNNAAYRDKSTCDAQYYPFYRVTFGNPSANEGKLTGEMGAITPKTMPCPGDLSTSHDQAGTVVQAGYK
ncbi:hypothetical protein [Nocardia sp. CDC160]|uniref:hypothetical protein n=1 Tax=Nocardia sp. CDC160 TaxID=3112166 RepID=UPI002DB9C802|nr:hypothetical protein [Nocardia sp. CDC160]MEC3915685.1 hypothetical protein [Nocardia sp. CDC160]